MSKHLAKMLGAFVAAMAALALMAPLAQSATPKPGYEQFAGCPSKEEKATITSCIRAEITGGVFKMGNKEVPITKPMVLSGGTNPEGNEFSYNSKGGLSLAKQKVPGGVVGLTGLTWLLELLGSEALTLYATTELAGQVGNPLAAELKLPIKVHLENSVLGKNCYVGSNSNPINLSLHYSTFPTPSFDPVTKIQHLDNGVYSDEKFSAPGANGCVLTLFGFIPISINGLVNSQSGLPAATGNFTHQDTDTEIVAANRVYTQ